MRCPPSCVATACTSKRTGSAISLVDQGSALSNRIPQSMIVPSGYVTPAGPGNGIDDPPSTGSTVIPIASVVVVVGASSAQHGVTASVPPDTSACQATTFTPSSPKTSAAAVCPPKFTTGTTGASATPSSTLAHVWKADWTLPSNDAWVKLPGIPDGLWNQRIS